MVRALDTRLCPRLLDPSERLPDLRAFGYCFIDEAGEPFVTKAGPPLIVWLGGHTAGSEVHRKILRQLRAIELR